MKWLALSGKCENMYFNSLYYTENKKTSSTICLIKTYVVTKTFLKSEHLEPFGSEWKNLCCKLLSWFSVCEFH